jgi:hypothetical protein
MRLLVDPKNNFRNWWSLNSERFREGPRHVDRRTIALGPTIGKRLKVRRLQPGLSQESFGLVLGVTFEQCKNMRSETTHRGRSVANKFPRS